MTKQEAKNRIEKLKKMINHHRYLYHVRDVQEISDEAFDSLKHELKQLEDQFPEFITPDSPTQRVGGEPVDKFEKAEHAYPMLSIDDLFSREELESWQDYIERLVPGANLEYFCEVKIDGFAISLLYEKGVLARAATRGNGKVGEDVTQNIKTIESIPLSMELHEKLPEKLEEGIGRLIRGGTVEVRGEVYMDKKTFEKVNREQKRKGEKEFANPRNLPDGSVRQLDPRLTASRELKFIAYDMVGDCGQTKHSEEHEVARALGFNTDGLAKVAQNTDEAFRFWEDVTNKRDKLPYHIDGIVISVNDNALFIRLGVAGK